MTARNRRTARSLSLPFPLFLLLVCAAVTIGATSLRALSGSGTPSMSGALAGTAGRVMAFLDYFAGVFTLLSLTAAVVCGLAATDRLVLSIRQRVAMQSVHRATSVAALGFLVTHIAVKVAEQDASPLTAILPFGGGATFAVSLGTIAADLLVLTAATGAVRGRFAGSRRPWLWRVLHGGAYACWPIALAHGLTAGRAAAVWVLWSYGLCAAMVGLALLIRLLGAAGRGSARRRTERTLRAYEPAPGFAARTAREVQVGSDREREQEPVTLATSAPLGAEPTVAIPYAEFAELAEAADLTAPQQRYQPEPRYQEPQPEPQFQFRPEQQPQAQPQYQPQYQPQPQPQYQPQFEPQFQQEYQPQYAYAYPAAPSPSPSPWSGEAQARPHPALAETPPHGFAVPGDLIAAGYAPGPAPAPGGVPDWLDDSGVWGALTWDTPPHGIPVQAMAASGYPAYPADPAYPGQGYPGYPGYPGSAQEHGGGW